MMDAFFTNVHDIHNNLFIKDFNLDSFRISNGSHRTHYTWVHILVLFTIYTCHIRMDFAHYLKRRGKHECR